MVTLRILVLCTLGLFFSRTSMAAYQVSQSLQKVESEDIREARKTAMSNGIRDVTLNQVSKMLGESRFKGSLSDIKKKVLTHQQKFIPFSQIKSQKPVEGGFEFNVEVKVSQLDLRKVLRTAGLLSSSEKTGTIFPFVEFNDHVDGESYKWWLPQEETRLGLRQVAREFEKQMAVGFGQKGMLFLKPETFGMVYLLPDFLRKGFLTQTEKVQIAALKKSQFFVEGKVDISESPLNENGYRVRFRMSCQQAGNGKSVAEVVRSLDINKSGNRVDFQKTVSNMAKEAGVDLARQISDLQERGALETQVLKLAVTGELNYLQMTRLKKDISKSIVGVKGLREHIFEPGRVTFEVDYDGEGIESLRGKLKSAKFAGFFSQVVAASADEVILDVKAQN